MNTNIHILDEENIEQIYLMITSQDPDSVRLGIEILSKRDKDNLASENIFFKFIKRLEKEDYKHLIYQIYHYVLRQSLDNFIQ